MTNSTPTTTPLNPALTAKVASMLRATIRSEGSAKLLSNLDKVTENVYRMLPSGDYGRGDVRRAISEAICTHPTPLPATTPQSGVAGCPCCGEQTMVNDLAKLELCDTCEGLDCEPDCENHESRYVERAPGQITRTEFESLREPTPHDITYKPDWIVHKVERTGEGFYQYRVTGVYGNYREGRNSMGPEFSWRVPDISWRFVWRSDRSASAIAPAHVASGQKCAQCGLSAWHVEGMPFCRDHDQETYAHAHKFD